MFDKLFFHSHIEDDETIHMVAHKHWMFGITALFLPTLLFAFVFGLLFYVQVQVMLYITGVALLASAAWWLHNFLDYYLDAWIITNKGIIDLAWHGWFHRESTRVLYSDVQGVSYEVKGISGTVFRYGDIEVEKISTGSTISLPGIPRPRKVQTIIMDAMEHYLHKKNLKDATTVQKILSDFVAGTLQKKDIEDLVKKK